MARGQTTLAHWGLNNNLNVDNDNAVGTPVATQSNLTFGSSSGTCEGTQYLYCDGDNDYVQLNINTTGFTSVTISWVQKWSSSGSNTGNWHLLGDSDNNTTYEYTKTDNPNTTSSCATVSVTPGASFDDKSAVSFRIRSNVINGRYLIVDDVTITGTPIPTCPAITATVDSKTDITCFNNNDGSITVSASGGTSPYTFSKDNGSNYVTANNLPSAGKHTFTGLSANVVYKIRAKDANGCESPIIP